jgi:feruloyl esterase
LKPSVRRALKRISLAGLGVGIAALSGATSVLGGPTADPASSAGAEQCSALSGRQIGGATIDKAEYVLTGGALLSDKVRATRDVCLASAHISPVAGSEIRMHIWLPSGWNEKMLGIGGAGFNGGFAAEWFVLIKPVNQGYAAVSADAGHDFAEGSGKWAFRHPEKIVDFSSRANYLAAAVGKAVVTEYYGRAARRNYFHGCSNGGRDALMMAQRHPQEYDGIVAGAPAYDWTALMSSFAVDGQTTRPVSGVNSMAPKLKLLHEAVLKQCDALDGVQDGLVSDPTKCRFDPAVLQCKSAAQPNCLSKAEVTAAQAIYRGVRTGDGKSIMSGFPPGSELQWATWFAKPESEAAASAQEFYRYFVYNDEQWDGSRFDVNRDYPVAKRSMGKVMDATDPDLRPFARHGGKLLMYHGWEDPAIPAGNSIRYFEAARRALGDQAGEIRLFMVPGLAHCFGGDGPNALDALSALDAWVESGKPPERLISSKPENFALALLGTPTKVLQTRPVCAWPKSPQYKGAGAVDLASSFICR